MDHSEEFPGLGKVFLHRGARHEARFIHREIFQRRDYLRGDLTIPAGATIVDVGANIGFFSMFALQEAAPGARLVALEPIAENFQRLQRNLAEAGRESGHRVSLINAGATSLDGPREATFTHFPNLPGNSTSSLSEKTQDAAALRRILRSPKAYVEKLGGVLQGRRRLLLPLAILAYPLVLPLGLIWLRHAYGRRQTETCQLVPLSDVLAAEGLTRVDLLKIDTEGAELAVLEGIRPQDWPKIRQVALEVQDVEGRLKEVQQRLAKAGFSHIVTEHADALSAFAGNPIALIRARR